MQHVVEVAADQQPLVGGPVGGAEAQAGHPPQRRLQQAGAQHAGRAHLAGVERCSRHRDARTLGELVHQGGVARRRGGSGRAVPHQDEGACGHSVAGERHDRADCRRRRPGTPRTGRPRRGVRPRCVGQVVRQQRCIGLLTAQRSHHRCGQFPGSGTAGTHRAGPFPGRPLDHVPARRRRPHDRNRLGQLGDGQLDHRPRRPPGVQGQAELPAGRGEEPGPGPFDEQGVRSPVLLGHVVDVPGGPAVGQDVPPRVQPTTARGELDLARRVSTGGRATVCGIDRPGIERADEQLADPQVRQQGGRGGVHEADHALVVVGEDAAPGPVQELVGQGPPGRAHVVRRARRGDRPVRVDVLPLLDQRDPPVAGSACGDLRAGCVGVDQVTRGERSARLGATSLPGEHTG